MANETVFFSYSRSDSDFVLKLANDLRGAGTDLWLDQLDIKAGSHWDASIETALNAASRLIVVLSPASVASNNVMDEVSFALETGKTVIPVLIKECTTPFRLRRLQRIDFTADYERSLTKLLTVLGNKTTGPQNPNIPAGPGSRHTNTKKYILIATAVMAIAAGIVWAILGSDKKDSGDLKAWNTAVQKNDSTAYALYVNQFPNGKYITIAIDRIDSIHFAATLAKQDSADLKAWAMAIKKNELKDYALYVKEFPNGKYAVLAKEKIDSIHLAETSTAKPPVPNPGSANDTKPGENQGTATTVPEKPHDSMVKKPHDIMVPNKPTASYMGTLQTNTKQKAKTNIILSPVSPVQKKP